MRCNKIKQKWSRRRRRRNKKAHIARSPHSLKLRELFYLYDFSSLVQYSFYKLDSVVLPWTSTHFTCMNRMQIDKRILELGKLTRKISFTSDPLRLSLSSRPLSSWAIFFVLHFVRWTIHLTQITSNKKRFVVIHLIEIQTNDEKNAEPFSFWCETRTNSKYQYWLRNTIQFECVMD